MKPEEFQRIAELLQDIAVTIAILAVCQRIVEAVTSEEKAYLYQCLALYLTGKQARSRFGGANQPQFDDDQQRW